MSDAAKFIRRRKANANANAQVSDHKHYFIFPARIKRSEERGSVGVWGCDRERVGAGDVEIHTRFVLFMRIN